MPRFVYKKDLRVLPSLAVVLAQLGLWPRYFDTGIAYVNLLHSEQRLQTHHPLPRSGTVMGRTRVTDVIDKGEGRGALLLSARDIIERKRERFWRRSDTPDSAAPMAASAPSVDRCRSPTRCQSMLPI
jgi:hypothetical protein